jgi:hypothetical protein
MTNSFLFPERPITTRNAMEKVDLKKEFKNLYNPSSKEVVLVDVPTFNFLMIDGKGDPNRSPEYTAAIEGLFGVSYTLKFMVKKSKGVDYAVMPLEGLWWVDDMAKFSIERKDEWKWTAMIMQPKYVTAKDVKEAIEQVRKKKDLPAIAMLRFECFNEGKAAQIMYIGPYSAEGSNIAKIHAFIQGSGHFLSGKHHEIYLNNPGKVAPEKLKTIIRQPMK